ncbi:hypothetical protein U0070_010806 [Myodes glareolus]|uniref:Small ribosomal subunit protein uS2 C-terminal domain-containing protein n=1 Tax=Myodes glareolus TaxID=447135 RepID=A0AAW0H239_MYOGA
MRGTMHQHPWEVMPDGDFYRDPEETEKEEQDTAEKAVTKEEFQGKWLAPAPEVTSAQSGGKTDMRVCRYPLYLPSSFLLKTGVPSQPLRTGQQLPQCRPPSKHFQSHNLLGTRNRFSVESGHQLTAKSLGSMS